MASPPTTGRCAILSFVPFMARSMLQLWPNSPILSTPRKLSKWFVLILHVKYFVKFHEITLSCTVYISCPSGQLSAPSPHSPSHRAGHVGKCSVLKINDHSLVCRPESAIKHSQGTAKRVGQCWRWENQFIFHHLHDTRSSLLVPARTFNQC